MTKLGRADVDVYAEGFWGLVGGLRSADGVVPATEYLDGLSPGARAKFRVVAERLAATGVMTNIERFHQIRHGGDPQVYEIKVHDGPGHRFYCVRRERMWIVTHGGRKPRNNKLYGVEVKRCHEALKERDDR